MEALFAILGGVAVAGIGYAAKRIGAKIFLSKYGRTLEVVFNVLDPLAGDLINGYDESRIQEGIQLVVARVADSDISDNDILEITQYVVKQFNPAIAASKKLDPTTPEGQATIELSGAIKSLTDGVTFDEAIAVARKAAALV